MSELKLSKRLCTAASFVRDGAFVADIGTDHAYLPIYLALNNKISGALASDINEGPILRAVENISKYNLSDKIKTQIANGLYGIEKYLPTDIVICGMGGELIARILDESEYVKNPQIKLILQPMTSVYELREYLSSGYEITQESIVLEDGKIYQLICAKYDGKNHEMTETELEIGALNIKNRPNGYKELVNNALSKLIKKLTGLKIGGHPTLDVENRIKEMEAVL